MLQATGAENTGCFDYAFSPTWSYQRLLRGSIQSMYSACSGYTGLWNRRGLRLQHRCGILQKPRNILAPDYRESMPLQQLLMYKGYPPQSAAKNQGRNAIRNVMWEKPDISSRRRPRTDMPICPHSHALNVLRWDVGRVWSLPCAADFDVDFPRTFEKFAALRGQGCP